MKTFRQSREASLIYTNTDEELRQLSSRKKKCIIICILALLVSVLGSIALLLTIDYAAGQAREIISPSSMIISPKYDGSSDKELSENISEKLLRLHVVANSDDNEDQSIKLEVRDSIITWLSQNLSEELSKAEAIEYLNDHKKELEDVAREVLDNEGAGYQCNVSICVSHFPGKVYGDFYLPAGDYDALKIVLGKGEGHNWWCIAFPALCLYGNADYEDNNNQKSSYEMLTPLVDEETSEKIKVENVRIDFRCKWLKKLFIS